MDIIAIKARTQKFSAETATHVSCLLSVFLMPISTTGLHVSLLCVVSFWLLSDQMRSQARFCFQHPVSKMCLGFFAWYVLGSLYSSGTPGDILDVLSKMSKLLYVPFFLPTFSDKKWRNYAMLSFIAAMILSLGLGAIQLTTGHPFLTFKNKGPGAIFKNHIDTNLLMAFSVFVLAQTITLNIKPLMKFGIGLLMFCMILYVLWGSAGRSGYFVFIALWILFCVQHLKLRNFMLGFMTLILVLTCATEFSTVFRERLQIIPKQIKEYQRGEQATSVGFRLQFYKNTFLLAKERPWFGWGTGSMKQIYGAHAEQNNLFQIKNPHNEYLNVLFQLGICGLLVLMGMFGLLFYFSFKLPLFEGRILQGVLISMSLGCFGNSLLMDFTSGHWFVFIITLCMASLQGFSRKTVHE